MKGNHLATYLTIKTTIKHNRPIQIHPISTMQSKSVDDAIVCKSCCITTPVVIRQEIRKGTKNHKIVIFYLFAGKPTCTDFKYPLPFGLLSLSWERNFVKGVD